MHAPNTGHSTWPRVLNRTHKIWSFVCTEVLAILMCYFFFICVSNIIKCSVIYILRVIQLNWNLIHFALWNFLTYYVSAVMKYLECVCIPISILIIQKTQNQNYFSDSKIYENSWLWTPFPVSLSRWLLILFLHNLFFLKRTQNLLMNS